MRNKWFEEQIVEFKTRSDSEVLEFLSKLLEYYARCQGCIYNGWNI